MRICQMRIVILAVVTHYNNRSWFTSLLVASLAIILLNVQVSSTNVCINDRYNNCTCINNNSSLVHCLTNGLNSSCRSEMARKSYNSFCQVLAQFDCREKYSVKWNCSDCLEAYTKWLIKVVSEISESSCLSSCLQSKSPLEILCFDVLAKCPHFAPSGGSNRPAFEC